MCPGAPTQGPTLKEIPSTMVCPRVHVHARLLLAAQRLAVEIIWNFQYRTHAPWNLALPSEPKP